MVPAKIIRPHIFFDLCCNSRVEAFSFCFLGEHRGLFCKRLHFAPVSVPTRKKNLCHVKVNGMIKGLDSHGLAELWLIDPYGPEGTSFYQRKATRLAEVKPKSGVLRSTAIPGFAVQVDWFWPEGEFITVRKALEAIQSL